MTEMGWQADIPSFRHPGLDAGSIAAFKSWAPDQVRGDDDRNDRAFGNYLVNASRSFSMKAACYFRAQIIFAWQQRRERCEGRIEACLVRFFVRDA